MTKKLPFKTLEDFEFQGKRVFLRVDFNVPLSQNAQGEWEVADEARIRGALPTIEYLASKGARIIIASHLGRPGGQITPKYSLLPVAQKLSALLQKDVLFSEDTIGDGPLSLSHSLRHGQVLLLENLRFFEQEEKNDSEFARKLGKLCDIYISDAFGALHRAHASTDALPRTMAERGLGRLIERELEFLVPLRNAPTRPLTLVMGGSKVSDKIGILEHFLEKADHILIGGAMAYAFLKAQGVEVGQSLCAPEQVTAAKKLLALAESKEKTLTLPLDHLVADDFNATQGTLTEGPAIAQDKMGMDIGPQTVELFSRTFKGSQTVFWNGPMGVFEKPAFSQGTLEICKRIAELKDATKIVGGGDSARAIYESKMDEQYDFISTGGGATLEFLEGKKLPGLAALTLDRLELEKAQRDADFDHSDWEKWEDKENGY